MQYHTHPYSSSGKVFSLYLFILLFSVSFRFLTHFCFRFFRAQEPKAPVTYCDHALSSVCRPSSVRPSVVRPSVCRPLDYLHFQLLFQNRLMDFDETWYGWSTQGLYKCCYFSARSAPGRIQGGAKIGHVGSPS